MSSSSHRRLVDRLALLCDALRGRGRRPAPAYATAVARRDDRSRLRSGRR